MKVRIKNSTHSSIQIGMEGEAKERPDLGGYEVTFKDLDMKIPGIAKKQDTTVFMKKKDLEFL